MLVEVGLATVVVRLGEVHMERVKVGIEAVAAVVASGRLAERR